MELPPAKNCWGGGGERDFTLLAGEGEAPQEPKTLSIHPVPTAWRRILSPPAEVTASHQYPFLGTDSILGLHVRNPNSTGTPGHVCPLQPLAGWQQGKQADIWWFTQAVTVCGVTVSCQDPNILFHFLCHPNIMVTDPADNTDSTGSHCSILYLNARKQQKISLWAMHVLRTKGF